MDITDRGTQLEEQLREAAIKHARQSGYRRLAACGACHSCGEWVHNPKLFCNNECAEDYESDMRRRGG